MLEVGVLPRLQTWLARVFAPGLVIPPPPAMRDGSGSDSSNSSDSEPEDGAGDEEGEGGAASSTISDWTQFALLGADIMVDEDGRPWLLEFNHNPALPELDLSAPSPLAASVSAEPLRPAHDGDDCRAPTTKPKPEPEPELELSASEDGGGRVGGAFARHIAGMVSAALPLVIIGSSEQSEAVGGALAASASAAPWREEGAEGHWSQVHGPPG